MSALTKSDAAAAELALVAGDLSRLTIEQRLAYYKAVCESVGLNPLTRPFDYLTLNSKLVLYAKRDATDQLRKLHGVSVKLVDKRTTEDGVYTVTAQATDRGGRVDESTGAVSVGGLKGDALANAYMKCETKAKRRVTLSICGLGMLDETEIETIPGAVRSPQPHETTADPEPEPQPARREVPLTLDDLRAKWLGAKPRDGRQLAECVAWVNYRLTDAAADYTPGMLEEYIRKVMDAGDEWTWDGLDVTGVAAAKEAGAKYLETLRPKG